ncbi:RNA-guided endonuclease InsQ/TnpB family protein [Haladaptatus sp. DFWS20]|uniref:RNA-guided endonuclease InsQ/TnpB family protein n=1 Tax=Haladaptatus sp. DFWS20 TaxID=3403467 RepID=UPI003EBD0DF4
MIRRTVVVKLAVPDERRDDLRKTTERFRQAAQMVADRAFERNDDGYVITSKTKLHQLTYQQVREATDGLNADLVCAARNYAADSVKGVTSAWQNGKYATQPTFTANTVVYNKNAVTYRDDHCTLAAVNGRVKAEYVLPSKGENPQTTYLRNDEWELRESTLHYRDGDYYLHVGVAKDDEPQEAGGGTVLGVDLGVKTVAATSTGSMWSGGYLNHRRREYEKVRGSLQQAGTESAHRTIDGIGDRESRWAEDYLHRLSKTLVQEAITHDCSTIAFEDLTDIRNRMPGAKAFHTWAFRRLCEYVEYKAKEFGISTKQVDPAYSSRRCSKCGHTQRGNRPKQERFCCRKCGYEVHADYNAAKNIGIKHVHAGQKSPRGRANRQLALKSGTLNVSDEYTSAEVSA